MNDEIKFWSIAIFIALMLFAVGWYSNNIYHVWANKRILNGFYADNVSESSLQYYENKLDPLGDFVCVNVAFDMTPKEALETVKHEVAHHFYSEIYAEMCEKDFDKCTDDLTTLQENITK